MRLSPANSSLLAPLERLYGGLSLLERRFFQVFSFLQFRPSVPVLSVGNLTMGGTGKTPLLLELLEVLRSEGRAVAVISRGYRSPWERSFYLLVGTGPHPEGITDEALLVNRRFPEVPVLLGKNRAHSARMLERVFKPDVILLDDGFQYRRLSRDLDIVLWDASKDPAAEHLIPRGTLREPFSRLGAAGLIVLTRCEGMAPEAIARISRFLTTFAPGCPKVPFETVPDGWVDATGRLLPVTAAPPQAVLFAAIGNPASFEVQLRQAGTQVAERVLFRDHHLFSSGDLAAVARLAESRGLPLVCTEKDRIKLPRPWLETHRPLALRIRMRPRDPEFSLSKVLARFG